MYEKNRITYCNSGTAYDKIKCNFNHILATFN